MAGAIQSTWAAPLAICCLLMTLLLIAGTIILALIPVYLPRKDISTTNTENRMIYAGYGSDVTDGTSLGLTGTSALSTQLTNNAGLSSSNVNLQSGTFGSVSASSRRKRQNSQNPTCERSTGLTGDIFVASFIIKYPLGCGTQTCQSRYKTKVENGLRRNYQTDTVSMTFNNSITRSVRLAFCLFYSSDPTNSSGGCTTETKNYIYGFDYNNVLYQFNPTTLNLTTIGTMNCTSTYVYAISLQRSGVIWGVDYNGNLFKYIISSQQCVTTNFAVNQSSISVFTMTFVKNDLVNDETLYITEQYPGNNTLGKIDITTLILSVVGNFTVTGVQDLTATSDGRLFAILGTTSYIIGAVDKTTANITAQYPLGISIPSYHNSGFAAYGSQFLLFSGNSSNSTNLYVFNPSSNTVTTIANYQQNIIGCAVSSCFGTP